MLNAQLVFNFVVTDSQRYCCRFSARDSGKVMLDALLSEILVTIEKISWLLAAGEKVLQPEQRSAGAMV
jgi:hypothetical protein